ncbi:coiled-coil domain-containing protein [Paenibacillus tianjinensis]|uniref:Chromosome segregation ATPase n=1 Tax=Paenibacillus tianjinensis TaxID=2810347 RepID=A0ABX7LBS6_9BACL|nr:chromosome segregation ATPase [Paenibacillus tianjinensis]QSF45608.1 chromosome segregation ATPase [Paenibacillus tianjinensis]
MPAISKIRFTNVVYEDGNKRYNDETFHFDGHNGAILLENGGGKTVFIQTALQAVLPHTELAGRKVKETLNLTNGPAHIAIEWILHERPRRYAVTCVTLFLNSNSAGLDSIRYVYDYPAHDADGIDDIPFVRQTGGQKRPADKGEMQDYYQSMCSKRVTAHTFSTIKSYHQYLEEQLHIISGEWEWMAKINQSEGGIEHFFDECKTTTLLFDRLLIPVVEASMSGYSEGEFAAAFQTHRDGFKRYKELKLKVEENERILAELDRYVEAYGKLRDRQSAYSLIQSEAKTYWQTAQQQEEAQHAELLKLEEQTNKWKERKVQLTEIKDSLHIAKQKQALDAALQQRGLVEDDKHQAAEELDASELEYYSLQFADYRSQKLLAAEQERVASVKLDQLESTMDERQLDEAWARNSGQIAYLLHAAMEKLTADKQRLEQECLQIQSKLHKDEQQMKLQESELRGLEDGLLKLEAKEAHKTEERDSIRKMILANADLENVEDKLAFWMKRQNELDESNVSLIQANKELAARKVQEKDELSRVQKEIREHGSLLSRLEERKNQQTEAHRSLLLGLKAIRPAWEKLQSVYDRQTSIERQLAEDLDRLNSDKERLLQKERLAFRLVDDYGDQERFVADPFLEKLVQKWVNLFTVLQTGTEYLEDTGFSLEGLQGQAQSLWPVTLIAVEHEKAALCQKLQAYAEQLQYPVRVISTSEAATLALDRTTSGSQWGTWVEPEHWGSNVKREAFAAWKQTAIQAADGTRLERMEQERQIKRWEDIIGKVTSYLAEYPLEQVQEAEGQLAEFKLKLRQLEQESSRISTSIEQLEVMQESNTRRISDQKDELNQLAVWIEQGRKYTALGREVEELRKDVEHLKEQREGLQNRINRHMRVMEAGRQREKHLLSELRLVEDEGRGISTQELFVEVTRYPMLEAEASLERLKVERESLYFQRQRISQSRRELELERRSASEKQAIAEREMNRLHLEHSHLSEEREFPLHGKQLMEELFGRIQDRKMRVQRLSEEYSRVDTECVQLQSVTDLLLKQYNENHSAKAPIMFMEPLSKIAERISMEDAALLTEKQGLEQLETRMKSHLYDIRDVIQELTPYKLMHGFENPAITPAVLTDEAVSEFGYNRKRVVKDTLQRLDASNKAVELEREILNKGRDRFKAFCRKMIKDVKLREMAEQGVEQARSYDGIVSFQLAMKTRIHRANHIAEETMRTHNQELEQYIVHLHSHLRQVTLELRDIPNKTRVKVENEWKSIYSFSIPEWEEQEGKGAIRQHLDWILDQLENDKYRNGEGLEQEAAVKRDLEKWLETKQLLQVVLQDKAMKVTCRKVTNENTLTRASYSWEQSNNWSGGEKWSKNMTLFLGLLNYTAEKRRHIQAGMKRHRTVILDNPFGKASSDHVLSPVFFIAEQLGFQIIALTAHAAGKFLQDYFPIVFSCRLRQTAGSGKQVMTKEKAINQAYFRDHAPAAIERLGSVAQVELF